MPPERADNTGHEPDADALARALHIEPVLLDHTAVPHIIQLVLKYASVPALIAFRATSRQYRDSADAVLFKHVLIDNASVEVGGFQARSPIPPYERLPLLGWEAWLESTRQGKKDTESVDDAEGENANAADAPSARSAAPKPKLAHTRIVELYSYQQSISQRLPPMFPSLEVVIRREEHKDLANYPQDPDEGYSRPVERAGFDAPLVLSAHVVESRPMFRDDAFEWNDSVKRLVVHYQFDKSMSERWGFPTRDPSSLERMEVVYWPHLDPDGRWEPASRWDTGSDLRVLFAVNRLLQEHMESRFVVELVGIDAMPPEAFGKLPELEGANDVVSRVRAEMRRLMRALLEKRQMLTEELLEQIMARVEFTPLAEWRQRVGKDAIEADAGLLGLEDVSYDS